MFCIVVCVLLWVDVVVYVYGVIVDVVGDGVLFVFVEDDYVCGVVEYFVCIYECVEGMFEVDGVFELLLCFVCDEGGF